METLAVVVPVRSRAEGTASLLRSVAEELAGVGGRLITVPAEGGYAAAVNAGAAQAEAEHLVALDGVSTPRPGWAGALLAACARTRAALIGGRVLDGNGELLDAGALIVPARFELAGFGTVARTARFEPDSGAEDVPSACDFVDPACIATPLSLFRSLNGFDETLDCVYALRDYALRVRELGRVTMYEPAVVSVLGDRSAERPDPERAARRYADRWRERIVVQPNLNAHVRRVVTREAFVGGNIRRVTLDLPPITLLVHGPPPRDPAAFAESLTWTRILPDRAIWAAEEAAPDGFERCADGLAALAEVTERRGEGYVVVLRTDTVLARAWLPMLVDAVEYSVRTMAATVCEEALDAMPPGADGRCTIVAPRFMPQHLRVDRSLGLEAALADWIARGIRLGRDVRALRGSGIALGQPEAGTARRAVAETPAPDPFASIVMLSWNAPRFTELAVESIRAHTRAPHEVILIDNGSDAETRTRLAALEGVRVLYNEVNTGFAYGCNQGMAAARGTHVVLLNNDVVVTDGWLEAMLDVQARLPAIGISAPRTNHVYGSQQLHEVPYTNLVHARYFAAERAQRLRGSWYRDSKIVGFCMCIRRELIDEIGGFDTRYGLGNYEDDDFCMRAVAAGYELAVCEDSFIHHFGSVSFRTNRVDYTQQMARNRAVLLERWGLAEGENGVIDTYPMTKRGFARATDYVPLPAPGVPVRRTDLVTT